MKVDCNRIIIADENIEMNQKGNRLCIVKDSCLGCQIDAKYCALNDLLEDAGVLKSWANWDLPNFREREGHDTLNRERES